ncbi:MAG TPA: KH domain-containing protein [Thermomicrobiaceae bacterium]|nr:KH domain-containing protein [Thermomicrobiaceae bacterium]
MEELQKLIEYIARNLVNEPDTVNVDAHQRGQIVVVTLNVPSEEMGKVIGREGRIARSMRTLLTIAASRRGLRASLDING